MSPSDQVGGVCSHNPVGSLIKRPIGIRRQGKMNDMGNGGKVNIRHRHDAFRRAGIVASDPQFRRGGTGQETEQARRQNGQNAPRADTGHRSAAGSRAAIEVIHGD
jgi:hypothetical protein